jgi:hypothetical protein
MSRIPAGPERELAGVSRGDCEVTPTVGSGELGEIGRVLRASCRPLVRFEVVAAIHTSRTIVALG